MPNAPKSDADCIEGAYEDAVGGLFKALFTNLESSAGTSTDQQYVAAFTKGLGTLKRAKTLALGVVGPAAPVAAAAVRRARKPRARRRK